MALAAKGFHNAGVVPNAAVDIAPKHSGTVFGLVNTLGSVSGRSSGSSQMLNDCAEIQLSNSLIYGCVITHCDLRTLSTKD